MHGEASSSHPSSVAGIGYLALDPVLRTREPARFASLLAAFRAGYARTFTGDEAEADDAWEARIVGEPPPQPVMRIVVAVAAADAQGPVIGGAAVEHYRASGCALVTYLYVDDTGGHRRRGVGRGLVVAAGAACRRIGPLRAVLAEAEWPPAMPCPPFRPDDLARARSRLGFFARLGARAVAVDYVQPALASHLEPVPWLRLLLLPGPDRADDERLRAPLACFVDEFHAALAAQNRRPVDRATLERMQGAIAATRPLTLSLEATAAS